MRARVLHLAASGFVDLSRIGSHQTCITSMFEPGAVTKYVPIGPLGPFFRVSPNQHITNRAYQYGSFSWREHMPASMGLSSKSHPYKWKGGNAARCACCVEIHVEEATSYRSGQSLQAIGQVTA
ncbi:hypothetical protein HaLaN_22523 [Haematococcus lacustris]|uniref:Uncharacterized protein n=1 Tax=Haematococcus lacustris TaxID=44745 RepID=A0A699ZU04_HAELA|nr:hypothetical protein HaLaN_22523 [Haematococcus lacustris]